SFHPCRPLAVLSRTPPCPLSLHDALPISLAASIAFNAAAYLGAARHLRRHPPDCPFDDGDRGPWPARAFSWLRALVERAIERMPDRKSTRLNSSHGSISYAVFCLQKKTRL